MISRSATVAVIAVLLSLAVHFLGVRVTSTLQQPPEPEPESTGTSTEIVAPGSAFEDLADAVREPVTPEPEEAAPPEPAEATTSQALVASGNPQQTRTPDAAMAPSAPSESTEPATSEPGQSPETTTVAPVGADDTAAAEPNLAPPAGTDTVTAVPQGQPVAPSQVRSQPPLASQPAALPPLAAPVPPVAEIPVVPSAPVVSLQPSDIEPETPITPTEPGSEAIQNPEETNGFEPSELAVTTSLRPRLPAQRPPSTQEGVPDGSPENTETRLAPSQLIESPLTAYKRDGANVFGRQGSGTGSGRQGFGGSGGSGNSDVTNYAGQVLVHLNRTPAVSVSGRGWARVFFQINPDGTLASVSILDGSGSRSIDNAAKRQVRNAQPFPRPPGGKRRSLNFLYRIN
ncbi:MAG: TonB family protein [Tateyamaria sp.]|uniref:TonB family protein n=1 Tax=Tateyamaria sp. TaxID=1929288 RepID=UPI003293548E